MADKQRQVFDVTCGDQTEGRISATSPGEAGKMADEMCKVHDGVQGEPKPRNQA
jgi:hypothetical protein